MSDVSEEARVQAFTACGPQLRRAHLQGTRTHTRLGLFFPHCVHVVCNSCKENPSGLKMKYASTYTVVLYHCLQIYPNRDELLQQQQQQQQQLLQVQ